MANTTPQMILTMLAQNQESIPAQARCRWALLVTFEEMDALVDFLREHPEHGISIGQEHAEYIKAGRAMLHINGTPVIPELMEVPAEQRQGN